MLTSSGGGGGRSMLTVADRGEGGVKFVKILLTSYVNAPQSHELNGIKRKLIKLQMQCYETVHKVRHHKFEFLYLLPLYHLLQTPSGPP